jgi:uncharacterized protein YcsI (UPF0317 family)
MANLTTGADVRQAARSGELTEPTAGLAPGFEQANVVILPADTAADFTEFCGLNPAACPLLGTGCAGDPKLPAELAAADIRTDVPRYRVYRNGECIDSPADITALWRDDLQWFLLGCSFSFESALQQAGVPIRHVELGCNVPMYRTNRECVSAGVFEGPLVVSMRPIPKALVPLVVTITGTLPGAHGAPVHIGDPRELGIDDLASPDYGDAVPVGDNDVPVFWACGVTPQAAAQTARLPFMITHAPGHMLVLDRKIQD